MGLIIQTPIGPFFLVLIHKKISSLKFSIDLQRATVKHYSSFLFDLHFTAATLTSIMECRFAEELNAESLELSKLELTSNSVVDEKDKLDDRDDGDDLSFWDDSDEKLDSSLDLDREWQRRHNQFHTIGYRDGLIAGKEPSAQEGFNIGFEQSVLDGYSWGVVRGVTSAFSHLPHQLKEKLIATQEKRNEFQGLYESVHSLSTPDALGLFSEELKAREALEHSAHSEVSHHTVGLQEHSSHCSQLRNYRGQL